MKNGTKGAAAKSSGPRGGVVAGTPEAAAELAKRHAHVGSRASGIHRQRAPSGGVVAGTPEAAQAMADAEDSTARAGEDERHEAREAQIESEPDAIAMSLDDAAEKAAQFGVAVIAHCRETGDPWPPQLVSLYYQMGEALLSGVEGPRSETLPQDAG